MSVSLFCFPSRNLGGKLGTAVVNRYKIETLAQLAEISLAELTKEFGEKTGWVGVDFFCHIPDYFKFYPILSEFIAVTL